MKPKGILTGIVLVVVLYALAPAFSNLWSLLIDTQAIYFIPEGSSLFTFRPTVWNSGSGDWWLYGEDNRSHYYLEDDIKISKQAAKACSGFIPNDHVTWCLP
jgi:hypothetical protein